MHHDPTASRSRLALLLAGCRGACRRRVAEIDDDRDPLDPDVGLPRAIRQEATRRLARDAAAVEAAARELGWRWTVPHDPSWPALLRQIADPPLGLFVRGELGDGPAVAVVGSRRATTYGLQVARLLGRELAAAGAVVVSGMARGVDREAHEGALDAGGPTWAVWGTGPDRVYPNEHRDLAARIVAGGGALLTEYPVGTPPRRHHFPERNRVVAGVSRVVVVVEAAARSGALVTARIAVDEDREVLAVPGSILSDLSVGPNALLRLGARPVVTPRDVLEVVGLDPPMDPATPASDDPVLAALPPDGTATVDDLVERLGMPAPELLARILQLEVDGRVVRQSDGRYRRLGAQAAAE